MRTLIGWMTFALVACPAPDAPPETPAAPETAAEEKAPAAEEAPAAEAPAAANGETVDVKNPLGATVQATKSAAPASGTVEDTLLQALNHQAGSGSFDGFLAFIHPSAKSEPRQQANLQAYQYKSSLGGKAGACVHDGALIVTQKAAVNAAVEGGGDTGTKVFVYCGEGRMPVPFTLYPDGDIQRVTVWGLN